MKAKANLNTEMDTKPQTAINRVALTKALMVSVLSVILGGGQLFLVLSPFNLAFLCGLPVKYATSAVVGSVVGCILFSPPTYKTYYIIALLCIYAVKLLLAKLVHGRPKPLMLGVIAFVIMSVFAVVYASISRLVTLDMAMMLIEALLVGTLSYFYAIASAALLLRKGNIFVKDNVFSPPELTSIAILAIPVVTALASITVFHISLGVVIGVVCIYVAIERYGLVGASVGSILVALALNLYSLSFLEFSGMLIIASFIGGVFAPIKRFGVMSAFVATSTFCLFLMGAPLAMSLHVIEILFATACYVLIPTRLTMRQGGSIGSSLAGVSPARTAISAKLNFASGTIKDLQADLSSVAKRFEEIDGSNIATVYDSAANKICRGCTMQLACWDDNCNETIRAFYPLNNALRQYSRVDKAQMPTYFQDNCCKLERLTNEINSCYNSFSIKENTKRHITQSRGLIIDQFNSIADMLVEVSDELADIKGYDDHATCAVTKAYTALCCEPTQVVAAVDRFGRTSVEIYTDSPVTASGIDICQAVSDATQKEYDLPSICAASGKTQTKIALFERATLTVDFFAEQISCVEGDVCGDCYEYFVDAKGYSYCILSDGMGSGKRAAIDSVMTCSILLKLIRAGFSVSSALNLINSSLLVKSVDESLATIDVAKIDLYTGETILYKAGAASSYLCKNGACTRISTTSLPVGIIREVEFEKQRVKLSPHDVLLMVSDGVVAAGEDWLMAELVNSAHMDAKAISRKIIFEAQKRLEGLKQDDLSVMVCKIKRGV